MVSNAVLVSSSEIAIKSEPVRRLLEKKLSQNLRFRLIRSGLSNFKIVRLRGRIIIECGDVEEAAAEAAKVFGVFSAMPAIKTSSDFAKLIDTLADYSAQVIKENETFAIQARRAGDLPYVSKDIEFSGGAAVLNKLLGKGIKVNLTEPDKTLYVEAREESGYIYSKILYGPGGLPIGFQGKVIGVIMDGSNSYAASWMMMKRGATAIPVTFTTRSKESKEVTSALALLRERVPLKKYPVYSIPLDFSQEEIAREYGEEVAYILEKRAWMKVCSKIGESERAEGIVTGESFDYSPSLTLNNLKLIDRASALPVYRPLIALGEEELKEVTKKIGGYAIPSKPSEITPSEKPSTLEMIEKLEKELKLAKIVDKALKEVERRVIT